MEGMGSIEASETLQTNVDTDSESVRITRARNEASIYEKDISSLPFVERLITVRESILPPEKFAAGQLISRTNEKQGFPRVDIVASDLLPSLSVITDQTEEAIANMSPGPEKDAAALRLASTVFVLGVLEHPGVDVNGQTFRVLSLSYLHELSSRYKDRYFPLKFSRYLDRKDLVISTSFHDAFASVEIPPIKPKNQTERDLIDFVKQFDEVANRVPNDRDGSNFSYNQNLELFKMAKQFAGDHNLSQLVEGLKPVEWRENIKILGKETRFTKRSGKEDVPETTSSTIRENVYSIFQNMGYKRPEITATIGGDPETSDKVTRAMLVLLKRGGPNIGLIQDYILGKPIDLTKVDKETEEVFELARSRFDQVGAEMDTILSNPAVSSKQAIEGQLGLIDRYEIVNEGLRDIMHREGWSFYKNVIDEMYVHQRENKPQAETIEYLEKEYLKNKSQS